MTPLERLQQAWIQAGYPGEHMPNVQFAKAAPHVFAAFQAGNTDFIRAGWAAAGVDFPFAPSHPRYAAMAVAYSAAGDTNC